VLETQFGDVGIVAVEILFILGGMHLALALAVLSCARSYFEKGRRRGMEEATRELARGVNSHYEAHGSAASERLEAAFNGMNKITGKARNGLADPYHAQLWVLGDAIGEACWLKGHAAGLRRKAPAEGKIRIDLSLNELLQLSWLAHLGFQHMMPNYRDFEIHRFSGEDDAGEGALAVSRIESAIPVSARPFADLSAQLKRRQRLISDWWQDAPDRITA
jgi:hypothetical protein